MSVQVRRPALQLYAADDVLANGAVMEMSHEALGVHMRLYCRSWLEGGLPMDHARLARSLNLTAKRFSILWREIEPAWQEVDGCWVCPTLEAKREKAEAYAESRSRNGRQGGRPSQKAYANHSESKPKAKKSSAVAVAFASAVTEETEQPPAEVVGALARATPHPVVNGGSSKLRAGTALTVAEVTGRLAGVLAEVQASTERRLTKDEATAAAAQLVFGYWATKTNSTRSLYDRDRERVLRRALSENRGNVSELMYAVDGALHDPWHNGDRDGTKHLGVDAIFRNRGKIEELAEKRPGYRSGEMHPMAERYRQAFEGGGGTP